MTKQKYLEEIAGLLEAILEETEIISSHRKKIPQIELDLVMENIRKLYESYHMLNKLNNQVVVTGKENGSAGESTGTREPSEQEQVNEPPPLSARELQAEVNSRMAGKDAGNTGTPERPAEQQEHKPVSERPGYKIPGRPDELPLTPSPNEKVSDTEHPGAGGELGAQSGTDPERSEGTKHEKEKEQLSIADKYKNDEKTLNDKADKSNGVSIADRLQQNRITDLKAALGINDKFLFINDLFRGDSDKYNEAIEALNELEGFQEASVHLNHLREQYGWDKESPVLHKLTDFLRRRYL